MSSETSDQRPSRLSLAVQIQALPSRLALKISLPEDGEAATPEQPPDGTSRAIFVGVKRAWGRLSLCHGTTQLSLISSTTGKL